MGIVELFRNPLHVVTKAEQIKAADTIQQQAERIRELEAQYNNLNAIAKANLAMWKLKEQQLSEVVEYATEKDMALSLILPMAKGYVAKNNVGSNSEYISIAESANALPLPKAMQG